MKSIIPFPARRPSGAMDADFMDNNIDHAPQSLLCGAFLSENDNFLRLIFVSALYAVSGWLKICFAKNEESFPQINMIGFKLIPNSSCSAEISFIGL